MPALAKHAVFTPIPVQLAETEFNEFILPHLSMPKRGPKCKLGYHRVFNLILWVLYTVWGQKTHTALPQPICIGAAFFHHPPLQSDTHSA
jgi:hypothetical protein